MNLDEIKRLRASKVLEFRKLEIELLILQSLEEGNSLSREEIEKNLLTAKSIMDSVKGDGLKAMFNARIQILEGFLI